MTCKQCKYINRCMSEASFLGQVFDPNYDGEHGCREFDTFTNADRIRAMSDDKLAEFLFGFECAKEKFGTQWDCQGEALEWLREPADQDDDEDEDKRLPRIGRWVLLGVGGYAGPVCSVCQDKMSWFLGCTTRYCPNCGAKMIGGGDGEGG